MKIYSSKILKGKLARQKKIGIGINICLWILTAFAAICVGIVFCQKLILKNRYVVLFGYTPFIISSGSMQPNLQVYDIVVVKKARAEKIAPGDIVTFIADDGEKPKHNPEKNQ